MTHWVREHRIDNFGTHALGLRSGGSPMKQSVRARTECSDSSEVSVLWEREGLPAQRALWILGHSWQTQKRKAVRCFCYRTQTSALAWHLGSKQAKKIDEELFEHCWNMTRCQALDAQSFTVCALLS